MAKHNLFLGTAAGSVGDLTMYRRDGIQISRVRVREVANPRTTGQNTQRVFFAPVARFYAPLSTVLETSFEGLSRSQSYSKFLSENIRNAKTNGWYVPKGMTFMPMPYTLSRGTLRNFVTVYEDNPETQFTLVTASGRAGNATPLSWGHFSENLVKAGYNENDQVTFIVIVEDGLGGYYPTYYRRNINTADDTLLADIDFGGSFNVVMGPTGGCALGSESKPAVAASVIISRFENGKWRRSTQNLVCNPDIIDYITSLTTQQNAIASYGSSTGVRLSDVYLNNGGADGSTNRYPVVVTLANSNETRTVYPQSIGSVFVTNPDTSAPVQYLSFDGVDTSTGEVIPNILVTIGSVAAAGGGQSTYYAIGVQPGSAQGPTTYNPLAIAMDRLRQINVADADQTVPDPTNGERNIYQWLIAFGIPASAFVLPSNP